MDNIQNAIWIDANTEFTVNNLPDRLPDNKAILYSSLFNLFNCPVGGRSRTFEPLYGSAWYRYLQEPVCEATATNMRMSMIQAIAKWEPRIKLNLAKTYISPDLNIPGYKVRISFTMLQSSDTSLQSIQFHFKVVS